ncbi:MAG TPA: cytochrome c [Polyangiaceae bacterium]|nr:cytochrome c [Polyangiaceae bacterium]
MRLAALGLFLALVGCNSAPGDLRTWRAEDHDHTTNPGQDQVVAGPDAGPSPELARVGLDEVTVIAWGQNCTRCHGRVGRGDGPQGPMFKATDLSNPSWQRSVTDEGIANTIKTGRGQMPPFASLPDSTVKSLVRLVRLLDSSKLPQGEDTEAPPPSTDEGADAPPTASAAPAASAAPVKTARPRPAPSAR